MQGDLSTILVAIDSVETLLESAWKSWPYILSILISGGGLLFSFLAFKEAGKAKSAAKEAGQTVKIATITIELSEISQKLDKLLPKINFNEARDLLTEISRRLRRLVSPYADDEGLERNVQALLDSLSSARTSLNNVKPEGASIETDAPYAVYYAIQNEFSDINDCIADLLGLFEMKNLDNGGHNVKQQT